METKNLISYNQAVLLKSLGFTEECNYYYEKYKLTCHCEFVSGDGGFPDYEVTMEDLISSVNTNCPDLNVFDAPTLEQVRNWLIEKHKMFVELTYKFTNDNISWGYKYTNLDTKYEYYPNETFDNHYLALSEGISKCLTILSLNHCANLIKNLIK